jgi:Predicted Na+-dependent transporter
MSKCFGWISDHLLIFVLAVTAFSLLFPQFGSAASGLSMSLLAVMVLCVSMTIRLDDLKVVKKYPLLIVWTALLQFVGTALFSFLLAKLFLTGDLKTGQILLGCLPADISAPLMVSLVGGSTALATAMMVFQMLLTPVVLPLAVSALSGVAFKAPVSYLVLELAAVILLPAFTGILLNRCFPSLEQGRPVLTGVSALCYLGLLLIVVSSNARGLLALGAFALALLAIEMTMNLFGYCSAWITGKIFKNKSAAFCPAVFILGSKEFGIATAASDAIRLNAAVAIPSAFYAIVQMISMPVAVKLIERFQNKDCPAKKSGT